MKMIDIREFSKKWFNRIKKNFTFKLDWLTESKSVQIKSIYSIFLYLIFFLVGLLLFYLCNNVPTRSFNIQAEVLKTKDSLSYDKFSGDYEEDYGDLTLKIPMTMKKELKDNVKNKGGLYFDINRFRQKNIENDTSYIEYFNFLWNHKRAEFNPLFNKKFKNQSYYSSSELRKREIIQLKLNLLLDSINNDKRINQYLNDTPYLKDNIYYIKLLQRTDEFFLGGGILDEKNEYKPIGNLPDSIELGMLFVSQGKIDNITSIMTFFKKGSSFIKGNLSQTYGALDTPHWLTLSDLGQGYFDIKLNTNTIHNVKLTIDFVGVASFSYLDPEPDERTISSITYTDLEKINQIKNKGLNFHATFSEINNKQTVRVFALTALLSLCLSTILKELVFIRISAALSKIRRRKGNKNEKEDEQHHDDIETPLAELS